MVPAAVEAEDNLGKIKMKKLIISIFVICAVGINAQNFNDALRVSDPGLIFSPRALGMGNAYTALSNDFSGVLFNPAGIGLVNKMEFSGSMYNDSYKNEASFFNSLSNQTKNSTKFNQFGFVFPFPTYRGSLVAAFGYSQYKDFNRALRFTGYNAGNNSLAQDLTAFNDDIAYDLGLSYPLYDASGKYLYDVTRINGGLTQTGDIFQTGGVNSWSAAFAFEAQKDIFVGATISIVKGDLKRDRQYWESDTRNNYPDNYLLDPDYPETAGFNSWYINDIISWELSAWDATLGVLAKVNEFTNVGFTVKFPRTFEVRETYSADANSNFASGKSYSIDPIENKYKYEVKTPYEISGGLAFEQNNLLAAIDVKFIDYTQMEFTSGLDDLKISSNNRDIQDFMRSVLNINAGLEYTLPLTGLTVRAGFMWLPSPYKDDDQEYTKKIVTGGVGFTMNSKIQFNVAYTYGWWKDLGDNYGVNLSRTFQSISHTNLMMGLKYYF